MEYREYSHMQTFRQFFTEVAKDTTSYRGSRPAFMNDDVVLVSTIDQINSTKKNKEARGYTNQIGVVVGKKPRSMASPYYIVKFNDGWDIPVIATFLRGPYKDKATAEKYRANPNMKDEPQDLTRLNQPKPENITPEEFLRSAKTERIMRMLTDNYLKWLDTPLRQRTTDVLREIQLSDDTVTFVLAYEKIVGLSSVGKKIALKKMTANGGEPCIYILRHNDPEVKTLKIYTMTTLKFVPLENEYVLNDIVRVGEQSKDSKQWNSIQEYIEFPFLLIGFNSVTDDQFLRRSIMGHRILNSFAKYVQRGPQGYVDFFLNNPTIDELMHDAGKQFISPFSNAFNSQDYKSTTLKALIKSGKIKSDQITDEMMVDLF